MDKSITTKLFELKKDATKFYEAGDFVEAMNTFERCL